MSGRTAISRVFTGLLGVVALMWSGVAVGPFWTSLPFVRSSQQIVAGHLIKDNELDRLARMFDSTPVNRFAYPARLRSVAILRHRLVESGLERGNVSEIDRRLEAARGVVRQSLAAAPADSVLWLILYWLENTENGFAQDNLAYLAASYTLGPREGWISIRRNSLALAVFFQLDITTQEFVVAEFAAMVANRMLAETTTNLTGIGAPLQDRLLIGLANVDLVSREAFAKYLRKQGFDLSIPGAFNVGERPWK